MRGSVKSNRMKFRSRCGTSPKSIINAAASWFQARMSCVGVMTIAGVSVMFEDTLHVRLDLLRRASPGLRGCGVGAGDLVHVGALVVGELKNPREGREHRRRRPDPALLKPCVVVGADRGELRNLLASEAGYAPLRPTVGQPEVAGCEFGSP